MKPTRGYSSLGCHSTFTAMRRDRLSAPEMMALDLRYVRETSLWLDLKTLVLTAPGLPQPTLIQAAALMTMAVPVVVFFLAQRAFMRGVVVTGVEK